MDIYFLLFNIINIINTIYINFHLFNFISFLYPTHSAFFAIGFIPGGINEDKNTKVITIAVILFN